MLLLLLQFLAKNFGITEVTFYTRFTLPPLQHLHTLLEMLQSLAHKGLHRDTGFGS